jgi:hypothetical protein
MWLLTLKINKICRFSSRNLLESGYKEDKEKDGNVTLRNTGCEADTWMELIQDHVQ